MAGLYSWQAISLLVTAITHIHSRHEQVIDQHFIPHCVDKHSSGDGRHCWHHNGVASLELVVIGYSDRDGSLEEEAKHITLTSTADYRRKCQVASGSVGRVAFACSVHNEDICFIIKAVPKDKMFDLARDPRDYGTSVLYKRIGGEIKVGEHGGKRYMLAAPENDENVAPGGKRGSRIHLADDWDWVAQTVRQMVTGHLANSLPSTTEFEGLNKVLTILTGREDIKEELREHEYFSTCDLEHKGAEAWFAAIEVVPPYLPAVEEAGEFIRVPPTKASATHYRQREDRICHLSLSLSDAVFDCFCLLCSHVTAITRLIKMRSLYASDWLACLRLVFEFSFISSLHSLPFILMGRKQEALCTHFMHFAGSR